VLAVIYTRQSLDRAGDGLAVARQAAECAKLCRERGWTVIETVTDNDVSASTGKTRPGFERVLDMAARREVQVVVCWHIDRLTRRLADLERVISVCEAAGVKLATVSGDLDLSTDAGRLVGRILASVARGEVERKGSRQRAAAEQRAADGKPSRWGQRAFGYADDRITVVPAEAAAIADACSALLRGGALRGVVRKWNAAGLATPQGAKAWSAQSVRAVLTNPRIAGLSTYKGDIVGEGKWPPLVREETWRATRALLADPSRRPPAGARTLLSGLARCMCGEPVWAGRSHHGAQIYKCSTYFNGRLDPTKPHVSRSAPPVDEYVTAVAVARLARPDAVDLLTDENRPDAVALREQMAVLGARLDELAAAFADGEIDRAQLGAGTRKLRAQIVGIEEQLTDAARVDVLGDLIGIDDVRARWDTLDLDRRRSVIDVLMTVTLHKVGAGARIFRPETVEITPREPS
jgi:DNA invertase Pin-like site-specific DNA recombinase